MIDASRRKSFEFDSTPLINPSSATEQATKNKNSLSEKEVVPLREPLQAFPKNFEYYVHPGEMVTQLGFHSIRLLNGPVDLDFCTKTAEYVKRGIEDMHPGRLKQMINEDAEARVLIEFGGQIFILGEDPRELKNHRKALRYAEANVLKNPTFFQQSAAEILEEIHATHQLLVMRTRGVHKYRVGEFRSVNMFVRRVGFDEKFQQFTPSEQMKFQSIRNKKDWSKEDQEFLRNLDLFIPVLGRENIEKAMLELAQTIKSQGPLILTGEIDPIKVAAYVHDEITRIHPFFHDGHGRLARLWMNILLGIGGIEPVYFPNDETYTDAIKGGVETFTEYLRSLIYS